MKEQFTTCIECQEYPCERYTRRGWGGDQWSRTAQDNLDFIKSNGMEVWLESQRAKRLAVEELLKNYNDGRSMSFYCSACLVMPASLINQAIDEMKRRLSDNQIDGSDVKAKAKALIAIIQELAAKSGIELRSLSK